MILNLRSLLRFFGGNMKKIRTALGLAILFGLVGIFAQTSNAIEAVDSIAVEPTFVELNRGTFQCPAPSAVKCKCFAESVGSWKENGGFRRSMNTAFTPNNQCANVAPINSNGNNTRLFCCYNHCGVLTLDVKFKSCKKTSVSAFQCQ